MKVLGSRKMALVGGRDAAGHPQKTQVASRMITKLVFLLLVKTRSDYQVFET